MGQIAILCFFKQMALGGILRGGLVWARPLAAPHGRHRPPRRQRSDAVGLFDAKRFARRVSALPACLRWTSARPRDVPIPEPFAQRDHAIKPALTLQPQPDRPSEGRCARFKAGSPLAQCYIFHHRFGCQPRFASDKVAMVGDRNGWPFSRSPHAPQPPQKKPVPHGQKTPPLPWILPVPRDGK